MSDVKDYLSKISEKVGDTYRMQTEAFSPVEYPLLLDLFEKNKFKTVLDIGTGEGNWISRFASNLRNVHFTAIDADNKLLEKARTTQARENIDFQNAMFNNEYSTKCYDCILARFSMEHVHDPDVFVKEAYKRLNSNGMFVVTEWFIDIYHNSNSIWAKWREKENEIYLNNGGHPRLALAIPSMFKKHGFTEIKSSYHCISPTTVNHESFYNLTIVYAILYNKWFPNIFTDEFTKQLIDYCNESLEKETYTDDYYLVTQTMGLKK